MFFRSLKTLTWVIVKTGWVARSAMFKLKDLAFSASWVRLEVEPVQTISASEFFKDPKFPGFHRAFKPSILNLPRIWPLLSELETICKQIKYWNQSFQIKVFWIHKRQHFTVTKVPTVLNKIANSEMLHFDADTWVETFERSNFPQLFELFKCNLLKTVDLEDSNH